MSMSGASSSSTPTQLEYLKADITLAWANFQTCKHTINNNNKKKKTPPYKLCIYYAAMLTANGYTQAKFSCSSH